MENSLKEGLLNGDAAAGGTLWSSYLSLVLVQILSAFGLVYINTAMLEDSSYDGIAFITWRFVGAAPLLVVASAATQPGGFSHGFTISDASRFAVLGLCLVGNQLFANLGVQFAGALVATCLQPFAPVLSAALATALGQERLSWLVVAGLLSAVSGAIVVGLGRAHGGGAADSLVSSTSLLGMLFLLIHAASWAAYCVFVKAAVAKFDGLVVTSAALASGLAAMACVVGLRQLVAPSSLGLHLPPAAAGPLAYWIVAISGVSYVLVARASKRLPASTVALFNSVQPAAGAALSVLLLGDRLRLTDLGLVGILAGLLMVAHRR